jgi:hypothetical protein
MSATLIQRYQPGGDIYAGLVSRYGKNAADAAAAAAKQTGDEQKVNEAITGAYYGAPLNTDTTAILLNQLETNPLGAPLEGLGGIVSNTIGSVENLLAKTVKTTLTNPLFLGLTVTALAVWLIGPDKVKEKIASFITSKK